MAPLSYPLFFFRKHCTCHTNNYMGKRNNCISLRIYLWKIPCGKGWKWHCRETKFRNFLEEHPSLKCLQRSNFSSRAHTFKISRYASAIEQNIMFEEMYCSEQNWPVTSQVVYRNSSKLRISLQLAVSSVLMYFKNSFSVPSNLQMYGGRQLPYIKTT